ncbi:MAG: isocitrate lyase/PEP mutase family protein [Candidatus Nanopelagicales bacterium]
MSNFALVLNQARQKDQCLVLPGAYDALSARIIESQGFEAVYLTGAGFANSGLGVPDIGLVTASELRDHVARVADVVSIPLVVDADTGFGNAINMRRTIRMLERAGASAIQIEDQVFPKKCGHFSGKDVISLNEMIQKIHAAVDARDSNDLQIIARTDSRAVFSLDVALDRAAAFKEAGADIIFVEAPESIEEMRIIGKSSDLPLVANMVEGGKTPLKTVEELSALGFSIALFANAALRSAQKAVTETMSELKKTGSTNGVLHALSGWEDRQNAVGKSYFDELESKYSTEESL